MLLLPTSLFGNTLYFPQVAFGGGYSTTFVVINTGSTAVSSSVVFYTQVGTQTFTQPVNLPAGGSTRFTLSSASGQVAVVWGVLAVGSGTVQGVATFDLRSSNSALITTAGILGAAAGNNFLVPVDISPTTSTGVALANVNFSTGLQGMNVILRLVLEDGTVVATSTDARLSGLSAGWQIASFVTELFPQYAGKTFKGTLAISVEGVTASSLAATALTLKEGLLSALPVIPATSSGTVGPSTGDLVFSTSGSGGATAVFQGQTFTADASHTIRGLTPRTYEIDGTLPLGATMELAFLKLGGVAFVDRLVPGSLVSLQGPSRIGTLLSSCNVTYVNVESASQPFRLQFTLTTSTTNACQTGQ